VNDITANQATLHTDPGCALPAGSTSSSLNITGTVLSTDCASADNSGCAVLSASSSSFGGGFNAGGGGAFALRWDTAGIAVYFWPAGQVPRDVGAGVLAPDGGGWGVPMARWPAPTCDPFKYVSQQSIIFDIALWCVARLSSLRARLG
jgi:hypothetical protein